METKEKWNNIVDFYQQNFTAEECVIQKLWEQTLIEFFGYSGLTGDVVAKKFIPIGAGNSISPDIIINNNEQNLFLIELKRYNSFFDARYETQLFSYLKQTRTPVGILICHDIYVYAYDFNKADNEQLKTKIEFVKDNESGIEFVELFEKGTFDKELIEEFVTQKNNSATNIEKIKEGLTSELVMGLVRNHFSETYTMNEIESALKDARINVSFINPKIIPAPYAPAKPVAPIAIAKDQKNVKNSGIGKTEAIRRLASSNYILYNGNTTYAHVLPTRDYYWSNPNIDKLTKDWYIILDDDINRKLYLFCVPKYEIPIGTLPTRNDQPQKIDLYIRYNDPTFTEKHEYISFRKYLIKELDY